MLERPVQPAGSGSGRAHVLPDHIRYRLPSPLHSHCWQNPFSLLVQAVAEHLGDTDAASTFIWLDLFGEWFPSLHYRNSCVRLAWGCRGPASIYGVKVNRSPPALHVHACAGEQGMHGAASQHVDVLIAVHACSRESAWRQPWRQRGTLEHVE